MLGDQAPWLMAFEVLRPHMSRGKHLPVDPAWLAGCQDLRFNPGTCTHRRRWRIRAAERQEAPESRTFRTKFLRYALIRI